MRVRNVLMAAAVAAGLGMASVAMADTFLTTPNGGVQASATPELLVLDYGLAGRFQGTISTNRFDAVVNGGYVAGLTASTSGGNSTFQTFCMEERPAEYFWPKHLVQGVVSTTNTDTLGNVTKPGSHAIKGGDFSGGQVGNTYGYNLSQGAAWLYYMFATGQLGTYDYAGGTDAVAIQDAFWYLTNNGAPTGNTWEALAISHFGSAAAATFNGDGQQLDFKVVTSVVGGIATGVKYQVRVLNAWNAGTWTAAGPVGGPYTLTDSLVNLMNTPVPPGTDKMITPGGTTDGNWSGGITDLRNEDTFYRQDQLIMYAVPFSESVPLPATVWSAGALLGLVVLGRARKSLNGNA